MKLVGLVLAVAAIGCGGLSEPPVLGRVAEDGSGCAAIETGVDQDGDGNIDDAEVTATTKLCGKPVMKCDAGDGKVLTGTIAIRTLDDWRQLDDIACIDGDLLVVGTPDADLPLTKLVAVTCNVAIAGDPSITTLGGLAGLHAIGGTLLVQGNDSLVDLDGAAIPQLPALDVIANRHLPDVTGLVGLGCGTALTLANDDELASLHGLEGHRCIGSLALRADPALASLEGLDGVGVAAAIDIDGIPAELRLPSLAVVTGTLHVGSVGGRAITLPALTSVGALEIEHGSATLAMIDLPQLANASTVRVESLPALGAFAAPISSTEDLAFVDLPSLSTLQLGAIGELDDLDVENTGLTGVSAFGVLSRVKKDLTMVGNAIPPKVLAAWVARLEIDGKTTIE